MTFSRIRNIFLAVIGLVMVSCGEDIPEDYISVDNGTIHQIIFPFTRQSFKRGVALTVGGPWYAELVPPSVGNNDWITINNNSGTKAGHYEVGLSLDVNETGDDRRATVMITCGSNQQIAFIIQRTSPDTEPVDPDELYYGSKSIYVDLAYSEPNNSISLVAQGDVLITGRLITNGVVDTRYIKYRIGHARYKPGVGATDVLNLSAEQQFAIKSDNSGMQSTVVTYSTSPQLNLVTISFSGRALASGESAHLQITYTGY